MKFNMGKANFIKEFKIYGDDGDLLDIVKKYIKEKSLKSIEVTVQLLSRNSMNVILVSEIWKPSGMIPTRMWLKS